MGTRFIPDVDDLERPHRSYYIRLGYRLHRIPYPSIGDNGPGFSVYVLVDWDHAGDIKFVTYKIIQIKRLITVAPELEKDWLTSPESFG